MILNIIKYNILIEYNKVFEDIMKIKKNTYLFILFKKMMRTIIFRKLPKSDFNKFLQICDTN